MALFTDGSIATISDLKQYESSILDVASIEGIDLEKKLELAKREIGLEIASFLLRKGGVIGRQRELSNVIVTEAIVHWHVTYTLALIYRDAFSSHMNDRYRAKWEEFSKQTVRAQRLAADIGVGMTYWPVPKAAVPELSFEGGGVLPARTYVVKQAWIGRNGATGAWSEPAALSLDPGTRLSVKIGSAPAGAMGAVIYVGGSEPAMYRQTSLPAGENGNWVEPESGLRTDLPAMPLQSPDYYIATRQEMLRG